MTTDKPRIPYTKPSITELEVRYATDAAANGWGRRDLLKFGARPDNLFDPPCVVGAREIAERHSHT